MNAGHNDLVRVGVVDFLNSWPLAWSFFRGEPPEGFVPRFEPPARIADLLARGELDVGLIPAIEVQRIPDLRVIPGLCIGSIHEVRSVLLVSRCPLEEVRRIALDENSRTSAALVRILAADAWSLDAEFVAHRADVGRMLVDADAALIIGDPALAVDHERYRVLDLAAEWRKLSGYPFVFAVWAVRPGVERQGLTEVFATSLREGLSELDGVVERAKAATGLRGDVLRRYFTENLHYRLEAEQRAGLAEYFRRAAARGLIARQSDIRYVG